MMHDAPVNVPARVCRCVDSGVIDDVVHELRHLAHRAALDLALEVGRVIVDRFYGGRTDVWRQRGKRCASFRKLAARPDLPMSASGVYRAVAIYEVWQRIGGIATWKHVGACHLRAVLSLPPADQDTVLLRAEAQRLSVRELEDTVAELRSVRADRRGRPRQSPVVRTMRSLERSIQGLELSLENADFAALDGRTLDDVRLRLGHLRSRCDELVASLPIKST